MGAQGWRVDLRAAAGPRLTWTTFASGISPGAGVRVGWQVQRRRGQRRRREWNAGVDDCALLPLQRRQRISGQAAGPRMARSAACSIAKATAPCSLQGSTTEAHTRQSGTWSGLAAAGPARTAAALRSSSPPRYGFRPPYPRKRPARHTPCHRTTASPASVTTPSKGPRNQQRPRAAAGSHSTKRH